MNNDNWTPENAPNVKNDFKGQTAEPSPPQIATKWELESLIAERRNPVRNLEYLPDSLGTSRLQDQTRTQREGRITYIEDLFAKHRTQTRDDFNINADDYLHKQAEKERGK